MGVVMNKFSLVRAAALATIVAAAFATPASAASPLSLFAPQRTQIAPPPSSAMAYAPSDQRMDATQEGTQAPARFKRQIVNYNTAEPAGTIVIDTPNTFLYFVLGNGK